MASLIQAVNDGDIGRIGQLILAGVKVNTPIEGGFTALYVAAYNGNLAVVKRLLDVPGININAQTAENITPLMIAINERHPDIAKRLLQHPRINVNITNGEHTAKSLAQERGYPILVSMIEAIEGIVLPEPAPNFMYSTRSPPSVSEIITGEEYRLIDICSATHIIFKVGELFFTHSKEDIQTQVDIPEINIKFECRERIEGRRINRRDINEERPYFKLTGPGSVLYYVPFTQILFILRQSAYYAFELVESGRIENSATYSAIDVYYIKDPVEEDPHRTIGIGYDGQVVSLISQHHCTVGTGETIFSLRPFSISQSQAGGKRKTRRRVRRRKSTRRRR